MRSLPFPIVVAASCCVSLATSNDQFPETYFGEEEASTYVDWLSTPTYNNSIFLPSSRADEGAALFWTIHKDQEEEGEDYIELAMVVRAMGWVGFGIAETGGMRGSDVVMYSAASQQLIDSHVLDELVKPIPDDCQSWILVNTIADDGFLIVETRRALDTSDNQDRPLLDDSSTVIPTKIIMAWGDSEEPEYHGPTNRVKAALRFHANTASSASSATGTAQQELQAFRDIMAETADGEFTMHTGNYSINVSSVDFTEYVSFCFSVDDLVAMGVPMDQELHTIGMEAIIDPTTKKYVHHFIMAAISDEDGYSKENCPPRPFLEPNTDLAFQWAPGQIPFLFPPNVGGPLGAGEFGYKSFAIQVHYNNPWLDSNTIDNSGVRIYWTTQKREHELGFLQIGDPLFGLEGSPVSSTGGLTEHTFSCPSSCSSYFFDQPVTLFAEYLHMHTQGVSMTSEILRDGQVLHTSTVEYFDFDQQGGFQVSPETPIQFQPGDEFRTSCIYMPQSSGAVFGLASQDEMCVSFIAYYPRSKKVLPNGNLIPPFCSYGASNRNPLLAFCDEQLEETALSSVADIGRTFGSALEVTCPTIPTMTPTEETPKPSESSTHGMHISLFVPFVVLVASLVVSVE